MVTSFKEIAQSIDQLYPPFGFRDLTRRFRYSEILPGELPHGTVSLMNLAERIEGKNVKKIKLLHYNTWLLRDYFKFADIIKAFGGFARFINCAGLSCADVLAEVLKRFSSSSICDKLFPPIFSVCGVSINPLNDTCKIIGSAADLAAWIIEKLGDGIDMIFDLIEAPFDVIVDVIFKLLGWVIPWDLTIGPDIPDIENRAVEIGQQAFRYDLVSLCEVWRQEFRELLLKQGPAVQIFKGPSDPIYGEFEHLGSGLLSFSPTYFTADGGNHKYATSGVARSMPGGCDFGALADSDKWARKGIQLTLVFTDCGCIELYSTHLYSGGDMPDYLNSVVGGEPSDEEKADVRAAQVDELAQFINKTHKSSNVAIIVGDFNISTYRRNKTGNTEREDLYQNLNKFNGIKFDDWYSLSIFSGIYAQNDPGHTNGSFNDVCKAFPIEKARPPAENDYYCDEQKISNGAGGRIDYIFIQRPVTSHTFNLDVSRIRRRAFKRPENHSGSANFMSDHLGLEVMLFISPRTYIRQVNVIRDIYFHISPP